MAAKKTTDQATSTAKPTAADDGPSKAGAASAPNRGAAADAERLVSEGSQSDFNRWGDMLQDDKPSTAAKAARVLSAVAESRPAALTPIVDRFVRGLLSDNKRVVSASAQALPAIASVAPARVAKHLDKLKAAYPKTTDTGKDGIVRSFATLCAASVAYQKRLEPLLKQALAGADPKTLVVWTEAVLPALKGEPHANARAVVEKRLSSIPRSQAQKIADFLGMKLPRRR